MKYSEYILYFVAALLISCSSDPCESLNCVNGNCIDGTCQCDEGFVGPLCDQLPCVNGISENASCLCNEGNYGRLCEVSSIVGSYFSTGFVMTDCPSYVTQYDVMSNVEDFNLCGVNESGLTICFVHTLGIREDGSYVWTRGINIIKEDGTKENTFFEFQRGSYVANNSELITTSEDNVVRIITITQDQLTWSRKVEDGGDDCIWTETYTMPQ